MHHPALQLVFCCSVLSTLGFSAAAQAVYAPKAHITIPTDSMRLWKDTPSERKIMMRNKNTFAGRGTTFNALLPQLAEEKAQVALDAAAIDPGILYNPEESRQPAGIVIVPQKEIDPQMSHDPGPFAGNSAKRTPNAIFKRVKPKQQDENE